MNFLIFQQPTEPWTTSALKILGVILTVAAAYALGRFLTVTFAGLGRRAPRAHFFFNLLSPILKFALWAAAAFIIITLLVPSPEARLAVLASAGLALGLGAQDLVKNVIGGLVILVDRPYQLGDRVKIGDAYGEIDQIGLNSTKLTTPDDTRVTIPNNAVLSGMAWNSNSGVPDCQVVTDLFLPHQTDPVAAREIGYEVAYSSPYILLAKPVVVLLQDGFDQGPFLRLRIKAYVYDHRFEPAFQSDITLRAKAEFLRRHMLQDWGNFHAPAALNQ